MTTFILRSSQTGTPGLLSIRTMAAQRSQSGTIASRYWNCQSTFSRSSRSKTTAGAEIVRIGTKDMANGAHEVFAGM